MAIELSTHFVMFMVLVLYIGRLWRCLVLGRDNFSAVWTTSDDKMHLMDHILGALLSVIGSLMTCVLLFVEMVSHLVGSPTQLHTYINAGLCVTLMGAAYIAWHLEKEEDPKHPFFHWKDRRKEPREPPDPAFLRHYMK